MLLNELAIALGHIASTSLKGAANAVLANLVMLATMDDDEEQETSTEEPMYGSLGWYGRPVPPVTKVTATPNSPAGRAEFTGIRLGDRVLTTAYRDLRINARVNPKEGEVGIAGYQGGFISLQTNSTGDGTNIMVYACRNVGGAPSKASCLSMDSTAANAHISLMHEYGQSITLTKEGNIILANKAGDVYVQVGDTGLVFNAASLALAAGVMLGDKNPALGDNVMLATQMLAWITQVNLFLGVIAPLFNAPVAPMMSLGPGAVVMPIAVPVKANMAKAI